MWGLSVAGEQARANAGRGRGEVWRVHQQQQQEVERLGGTVGWLTGMVARMVNVEGQLVVAVTRLERRSRPPTRLGAGGRHARPAPVRPLLRLLVQTLALVVAGLAAAVVFSSGSVVHPGVGVPAAEADPTTTSAERSRAGKPPAREGATEVATGVDAAAGVPRAARSAAPAGRAAGTLPPVVVTASTAPPATLPPLTTAPPTTLPTETTPATTPPATTPPTSTTRLCRNPHGCD